jgi:quercetin dioxygenase-like cupin family protein
MEAEMEMKRVGSQSSVKEPSEWFIGAVRIEQPFQVSGPARVGGATITFDSGARTAWHTHSLGQTLIVTAGCGRVWRCGGSIEEIQSGDAVRIELGEKHWYGVTPTATMPRTSFAEKLDGAAVNWTRQLNDQQYLS